MCFYIEEYVEKVSIAGEFFEGILIKDTSNFISIKAEKKAWLWNIKCKECSVEI